MVCFAHPIRKLELIGQQRRVRLNRSHDGFKLTLRSRFIDKFKHKALNRSVPPPERNDNALPFAQTDFFRNGISKQPVYIGI